MESFVKIKTYKNGRKKVEFDRIGIYGIIRNKLGFRYTKINGKGYYLKENNGTFERAHSYELGQEFTKYLEKEFENFEFSKEIGFKDFMNQFHSKHDLLRNGKYSRECLGKEFELSKENLHLILLEIEPEYFFKHRKQEMLAFIKSEGFIETIDKVGNFDKDCPLFYKKISESIFLIFNMPFCNAKSEQATFDLWKIKTETEKEFLSKRTNDQIGIMLGFDLKRDLELYHKELR